MPRPKFELIAPSKIRGSINKKELSVDLSEVCTKRLNGTTYGKLSNLQKIKIEKAIKGSFEEWKKDLTKRQIDMFYTKPVAAKKVATEIDQTPLQIGNFDDYSKRKTVKHERLAEEVSRNVDYPRFAPLERISAVVISYLMSLLAKIIVRLVIADKIVNIEGLGSFKLKRKVNTRLISKGDGTTKLASFDITFASSAEVKQKISSECGVLMDE